MLMNSKLIVADDFYEDPLDVRKFALSQDFDVRGNFPNSRTKPLSSDSAKSTIQKLIMPHGGKITEWPNEYNGAFQFTTQFDRSWIHADNGTTWAALVYLTPNAPLTAGTAIFRHKETGLMEWPMDKDTQDKINADSQDLTKWEIVDRVGNVFNRIVLYRGYMFHQSLDYFGRDKFDGRLFQTFFFSTQF